ncbi:MAG: protein kinase [Deltaproteobacteria bacterium]|nr:protein kinase [Deltaproteobacteria bacterium]
MERRKNPRRSHPDLPIAIAYPAREGKGKRGRGRRGGNPVFVNLIDSSEGGLCLGSSVPFEEGADLDLNVPVPSDGAWKGVACRIVSVRDSSDMPGHWLLGVTFETRDARGGSGPVPGRRGKGWMGPEDLEFLLRTPLFDSISLETRCPLLNRLQRRTVRAGKRLIAQGEEGDSLFLIRRGSCLVSIEKDHVLHPVSRLQAGDIVGEMAMVTGEPRFAHVDAETDMELWGLTRGDFDQLCEEHTELRNFLTSLITRRFSTEGLQADRAVGKYVINEIIGKGGWSFVYRGIHRDLSMPVAVKMLKHDMAMNIRFLERFRQEAKTIARLNHDNIVKVYDIEEQFRTIFVVMECLEGVSLGHMLKKMIRLPLPRALGILMDICAGLSYAHAQGIVHQDIKPGNIFVLPSGRAKIMDFGLACSAGTSHSALTGTFFYMSPEQIRGEPVDARTDIYSLGLTAFEMITGRHPFPRDSVAEALSAQLSEDIPDPHALLPDLPDEVRDFLIRSTNRTPKKRYRNVAEILNHLMPLAEGLGVQTEPRIREQRKMMSLFLFYREEHQLPLKRLVEEFDNELKKIGAVLRAADFEDL